MSQFQFNSIALGMISLTLGVSVSHAQMDACCLDGGFCVSLTQAACESAPGAFQGSGSTCPGLCAQQGACCFADGSCEERYFGPCDASEGTFQGDGTTCSPNSCPPPAPVPTQINHQGVVSVNGQRFTGNGNFYFAIIDPANGNSVWTNDATNIGTPNRPNRAIVLPCATGLYNVRLGDLSLPNMKVIPVSVFSSENRSLRIWFDDGPNGIHQLSPDHPLTSAPYAFRAAQTSNTSGGISFGDGSDGNFSTSGDVTLTRDQYYENLTVSDGTILYPNGYRIFVRNALTLAGNAKISGDGPSGGAGEDGEYHGGGSLGGSGGSTSDGYLVGSSSGGGGIAAKDSAGGNGTVGSSVANALLNVPGAAGGNGGASAAGISTPGGTGGAGGLSTAANVKLIADWNLATLLDVSATGSTIKFKGSGSAGGGGAGGSIIAGGGNQTGGGGGGGGGNGRIIAIYARKIVVESSASISANGGNGGKGGNGGPPPDGESGGGGGGGGGGNGGIIVIVYNELAVYGSMTVTGGVGGAKGIGTGGGVDGTAGENGIDGIVYWFQVNP